MKKDSNVKTQKKQRYPRTRDPPVYLQECISTYLYLIPASTSNKCTGIHKWMFPMLKMSCAKKTNNQDTE